MNTNIRYNTSDRKNKISFTFSITFEYMPMFNSFFCSLPWVERNKKLAPIIEKLLSYHLPNEEMNTTAQHLSSAILAILQKRKILQEMKNLEITKAQLN